MRQLSCAVGLLWLISPCSLGGALTVAVASNFHTTAAELAEIFTARHGHQVRISSASTGTLYNQIRHGAGFDILLAADQARPMRLEQDQLAVAGSRFTYAIGQLVLWPASAARATAHPPPCAAASCSGRYSPVIRQLLQSAPPRSVAIANPALAPYGLAAQHTYQALGLWESASRSRVMGSNIAQAYQFVATGNARLGLVALAQITDAGSGTVEPHWPVPVDWYPPIEQQAVWLTRASDNDAARTFMAFLHGAAARAVIQRHGYRVP